MSLPIDTVRSKVELRRGATSISTENGQLANYVCVDVYVADARRAVAEQVTLPPGYTIGWNGQFEYLQRAEARIKIVVPVTLIIIF